MSVELSHRLAWVRPYLARELAWSERYALWLACERAAGLADLRDQQQRLILDAEAARERAIAERRSAVGR
jgi:hypothetical protein